MFVAGKSYWPGLMFIGKAKSQPRGVGENLKGVSLDKAPALLANIRLGRKGLPGTNTLAYKENS